MNRGLLLFAILLIFLGVGTGFYYLYFIGFILLFPALLIPSKPPAGSAPPPATSPPPRRVIPSPARTAEPTQQVAVPQGPAQVMYQNAGPPMPGTGATAGMQMAQPLQSFSPPLFATSMFPSFSAYPAPSAQPRELGRESKERTDELLELGVLALILRLAAG